MVECLRCGMCCHFIIDGTIKSCPNLVELPDKKTKCKIYDKRLGKTIFKTSTGRVRCKLRVNGEFDYPGCPFNTDKPCFVEHIKKEGLT